MRVRKWGIALLVGALGGLSGLPGAPRLAGAAGFTVRASNSTTGGEGNGLSTGATLSDDGRYVAFTSAASNLVVGDTNGFADVFVFDRNTLTTTLVTVDAGGNPSDGASDAAMISGNGRYVVFASDATDLVAGDTNGFADVFRRDLQTNTTVRVSLTDADLQIDDGDSYEPSVSDDGTKVEFSSDSGSVVLDDLNDSEDVFVRNLTTNATSRVSVATNGTETDFGAYEGQISGDGSTVVFTTDTGLVATDINDEDDVYRHTLSNGATNRVSSANTSAGGGGYTAAVSDSGAFIAFISDYELSGPGVDTNFLPDVYVRNVTAGTTARVSIPTTTGFGNDLSLSPSISDDGRYVTYFTLATNLGGTDSNGTFDVWMRDRTLNTNTRISLDALGGDPNGAAELPFIAGGGGFVAFQSLATDLGPAGETSNVDIFVRSLANDTTNPTATITVPADGATYARGAVVPSSYACVDNPGGSGIGVCEASVDQSGDPIDTATLGVKSFVVAPQDAQGNSGAAVIHTYTVVDVTAPLVTIGSPLQGSNVPQGAPLFAEYACSDEVGGSGLATCAGPVADGAAIDTSVAGPRTFTVNATDAAGNPASLTVSYTVVDVAGPDITIAAPIDGATYARGATVLADFACTDEVGGSGVASCVGTVADGAAINTSTLGTHTFTVNASDNSGNSTSRTATYTVTDQSPPTISVVTPVEGATYGAGSTVLADYSCADDPGGSGIAVCEGSAADGDPIDTTLGVHEFAVLALDVAGNGAGAVVSYEVVDVTDPTAAVSVPLDGAVIPQNETLIASFSCADEVGGSGVASCVGTVANGSPIDTSTVGLHAFSVVVTDNAGNSATVTVQYVVVDVTPPDVTITTPANGAVYPVGANVIADYSCSDPGGGPLELCSGTVADGAAVDTSTPGSYTFEVLTIDVANNPRLVSVTYTVVAAVTASVGDATVVENDTGGQVAKLTVVLNQAASAPATVHYSTVAGSATAADFRAKTGTLTFKPGQVTKTLTIALFPDSIVEPTESFGVVLDTPTGVAIGDGDGAVTILDDDVTVGQRVSVSDGTTYEGNSGSTRKVFFVVALAQPSAGGVSVHYTVADDTAVGGTRAGVGVDYKTRSGTLVFNAGQRFKVVSVTLYGDTQVEGSESFDLVLDTPVGATIHRGTGKGIIASDD